MKHVYLYFIECKCIFIEDVLSQAQECIFIEMFHFSIFKDQVLVLSQAQVLVL